MNQSTKKLLASTWAKRAQAELGAEQRFQKLGERLSQHGIEKNIIALVNKAREDEKRHSVMCADLAKSFGHPTGYELTQKKLSPLKEPWKLERTDRENLVIDVILTCCITETMNASLLNTIYSSSKHTATGKIIHEILQDEVLHGKIGWAFLANETSKNDCSYISKYLPEMLSISSNDELFLPFVHDEINDSIVCDGVLHPRFRMEQFKETLSTVVLPGFEKFGIHTSTGKEWISSHLS